MPAAGHDLIITEPYATGAALVAAMYDHLLTLSDEISVIWTKEVNLAKVVFFFTRYGSEALLIFASYGMFVRSKYLCNPLTLGLN